MVDIMPYIYIYIIYTAYIYIFVVCMKVEEAVLWQMIDFDLFFISNISHKCRPILPQKRCVFVYQRIVNEVVL